MGLHLTRTAALSAVLLVTFGPVRGHDGGNNAGVSETQRAVEQAVDHTRLADYFRDLASQERALAESYVRIATLYKEKSAARWP